MKRDAKTVAGWDFTRIIPCHGVRMQQLHAGIVSMTSITPFNPQDVIEEKGKEAWREAFKWYLE